MLTQQNIIELLTPILQKHPVKSASLVGSYARGDFNEKSDLDLVVDFWVPVVGLGFYELREDILDVLSIKLDLIYRPGLQSMEKDFRDNVNREEVAFYETNSNTSGRTYD